MGVHAGDARGCSPVESGRAFTMSIAAAVLLLVVWSIFGLDWSAFSSFDPSLAGSVVGGLAHPDFSFVYDGSGEDLMSLLLLTLAIAWLGTSIATVLAIPMALLSSKNLWHHGAVPRVGKCLCSVLRSFPELIYAIIFVKVVGPGPFAGVMAIGVHQIGMLGKLFTEQLEAMDGKAAESIRAVGGNFWQELLCARLPQLVPMFSSLALNHFEIAVRSASTLGLVGAGGIGAPLIFAMQNRAWSKVSIILLGVIVMVLVLDFITGLLRKRMR